MQLSLLLWKDLLNLPHKCVQVWPLARGLFAPDCVTDFTFQELPGIESFFFWSETGEKSQQAAVEKFPDDLPLKWDVAAPMLQRCGTGGAPLKKGQKQARGQCLVESRGQGRDLFSCELVAVVIHKHIFFKKSPSQQCINKITPLLSICLWPIFKIHFGER